MDTMSFQINLLYDLISYCLQKVSLCHHLDWLGNNLIELKDKVKVSLLVSSFGKR